MSTSPTTDTCFQALILKLQQFWADQGCVILQPYDMEVGGGSGRIGVKTKKPVEIPARCLFKSAQRAVCSGTFATAAPGAS